MPGILMVAFDSQHALLKLMLLTIITKEYQSRLTGYVFKSYNVNTRVTNRKSGAKCLLWLR